MGKKNKSKKKKASKMKPTSKKPLFVNVMLDGKIISRQEIRQDTVAEVDFTVFTFREVVGPGIM